MVFDQDHDVRIKKMTSYIIRSHLFLVLVKQITYAVF